MVLPKAFPVKPILVVNVLPLWNVIAPASEAVRRCAPPATVMDHDMLPVAPVERLIVKAYDPLIFKVEPLAIAKSVPLLPAIVRVFALPVCNSTVVLPESDN